MVKAKVLLDSVDKVRNFVNITEQIDDTHMDIACGSYTVDAKSMMGIFLLTLTKPLDLHVYAEKPRGEEILAKLQDFTV